MSALAFGDAKKVNAKAERVLGGFYHLRPPGGVGHGQFWHAAGMAGVVLAK
jgi:hypothetical protein